MVKKNTKSNFAKASLDKKDVKTTAKSAPKKEVEAEAQASDEAGVPTDNVGKEPKVVEGEVVQTQPVQPQVKQSNGTKWCCCCGIIFAIFILLWILVQVLSFSGFMPLPFIF